MGQFPSGSQAFFDLCDRVNTLSIVMGSNSTALSSPVYVPPREETWGQQRALLFRTAAGKGYWLNRNVLMKYLARDHGPYRIRSVENDHVP